MGLPYLASGSPAFAFVVHPRDEDDMIGATCLSLLREISHDHADFVSRVRSLPPTIVGDVVFGFSPFGGELVSIACLPEEILSLRGREEVLRAVELAVGRGASVIGLGALTAPATQGGEKVLERVPPGVTVTNGNAYTAAVLRANVAEAAAALEVERPCIAVVGCTGSVGAAVSRLLARDGFDLLLIGRSAVRAKRVLADLAPAARFSGKIAAAGDADVVLLVTSEAGPMLSPDLLRAGAVVIDAAEPPNVADDDARWSSRVTVVRGGRVRIPECSSTYDFGLEDPGETYACLAETYLFAREGIREHSVGAPEPELCERLERVALRHGVQASPLGLGREGQPLKSIATASKGGADELVSPR